MQGGQHKPNQTPCAGWTLAGVGPKFRQKQGGEGPVPAYTENTTVCGGAPTSLPYPLPCGGEGPPVCTNQFDWKTCGGGGCGPWPVGGSVPANTFLRGFQVNSVGISNGGINYAAANVLNVAGGTPNNNGAQIRVDTVDGSGKITAAHVLPGNGYSVAPATPNTPTGGGGSGAVFVLSIIPAVIDLSLCQKKGFKNVQAMRRWHGRYGYVANLGQGSVCIPFEDTDSEIFPSPAFQPYTAAPPATKYCQITASASIVATNTFWTPSNGTGSGSVTNRVVSINPLSGVITLEADGGMNANGFVTQAMMEALMEMANGNFSTFMAMFSGFKTELWNQTDMFVTSYSSGVYSLHWVVNHGEYPAGMLAEEFSVSNGSCSRTMYGIISTPDCVASQWGTISAETLTWDDSSVNYSLTQNDYPYSCGQTITTLSATLGNPNPSTAVLDDCATLRGQWNLFDDMEYPWRTDNGTGLAPLVTRNEVRGDVNLDVNVPYNVSWTDPNAPLFDGGILGAPFQAGYGWRADGTYDGVFDFRRENMVDCESGGTDIQSYGHKTPVLTGIPANCPQWTPDNLVALMPPGKWILYGPVQDVNALWVPGLGVWTQGWRQIEDEWPSYNFGRPAGADKFTYDETTTDGDDLVYQVTNISGNTVSLCDNYGSPLGAGLPVIPSGSVWGGPSVGGFYNISSAGISRITLGTKVFNIPTGWTSPSGDTATAFGRLRFPTCPGILGRAAVSAIVGGTVCTLTTESLPYLALNLVAAEAVDICDALMNVLAANISVTRVNDTTFTVPNSGGSSL